MNDYDEPDKDWYKTLVFLSIPFGMFIWMTSVIFTLGDIILSNTLAIVLSLVYIALIYIDYKTSHLLDVRVSFRGA